MIDLSPVVYLAEFAIAAVFSFLFLLIMSIFMPIHISYMMPMTFLTWAAIRIVLSLK